jgi:hypothetical protein
MATSLARACHRDSQHLDFSSNFFSSFFFFFKIHLTSSSRNLSISWVLTASRKWTQTKQNETSWFRTRFVTKKQRITKRIETMNIQEQQQQQRFTTTSHLTFVGCRRLPALLSSTIDFSHTAPQPAAGPIHTPEQSCFCVMYTYSWLSFVQQPTRTFPSYFVVGFCVFPYIYFFFFFFSLSGGRNRHVTKWKRPDWSCAVYRSNPRPLFYILWYTSARIHLLWIFIHLWFQYE